MIVLQLSAGSFLSK